MKDKIKGIRPTPYGFAVTVTLPKRTRRTCSRSQYIGHYKSLDEARYALFTASWLFKTEEKYDHVYQG